MGPMLLAAVKENHSLTKLNITGTGLGIRIFMLSRIHMRRTDPSAEVIQEDRLAAGLGLFPPPPVHAPGAAAASWQKGRDGGNLPVTSSC